MNLIILSIGDVFEGILIVIIIVIVLMLLGFFMQWISSVFNVGIRTRYGSTIARPKDWENTKEMIKGTGSIIKETTVNLYDTIKNINPTIITILKSKRMDRLEKLNYLSGLKDQGIINIEEFETLKKDIINGLKLK